MAIIILGYLYFQLFPEHLSIILVPCPYYRMLGTYCPGCGGTRSVWYLLQGDIKRSLLYHPMVLYSGILFLIYMSSHTLALLTSQKVRGLRYRNVYIYTGIGIIISNWLFKNYSLLYKGVDLLRK